MDTIDVNYYSRALGTEVNVHHLSSAEDPFGMKCTVRIGTEGRYLDTCDAKDYLDKAVKALHTPKNLEVEKEPDTMLSVLQEIRDLLKDKK